VGAGEGNPFGLPGIEPVRWLDTPPDGATMAAGEQDIPNWWALADSMEWA
jgi:hypothetical protein